ncbi:YceG-like family protein [Alkalithermobacter thermoalcaliphilus JW-YL-7 = DSM 7308]|uniref:Aminodeoxychorismate lyase n=1 Tax=Alkalithermobacter thermoalcaliphilus JW-YL-7 = DSM 7308 TaxID=1121328 RepID=A0A150FQE1_CLOPD|nr:aminodeoxychorismate lyase [[Clostridium] paradoxum JW-YL-7 = DSM 7308]SHK60116.1 YceG-like family protein [[Clostridium] paradoxum JW-YL-7 = DSM 7308]
MKKAILSLFLLGFSLGLMICSTLNIVINNGNLSNELDDKDVNRQEIKLDENLEENKDKISKKEEQQNNDQEYVNIKIETGYTSDRVVDILYENELISNKEDFKLMLNLLQLNGKIKVGEKQIKKGSSMKSIIHILTN